MNFGQGETSETSYHFRLPHMPDSEVGLRSVSTLLSLIDEKGTELTTSEAGLLYLAFHNRYHPLGCYWALLGGLASSLLTRGRTLTRRLPLVVGSSLFTYEASALTLDDAPADALLSGLTHTAGSLCGWINRNRSRKTLRSLDEMTFGRRMLNFVTLDTTLKALGNCRNSTPGDDKWLAFLKRHSEVLQHADVLSAIYWKWVLK